MPIKEKETEIRIAPMQYARNTFYLLGESPLLMHRFSKKARQELLMPARRKNRAGLESTLKHEPENEFRECCYLNRDQTSPTMFHLPSGMITQAIAAAALDLPGSARKTQILRLVSIKDPTINVYGTPALHMEMVRSSGIQRTPDVRTRACFRDWAAMITIEFPVGVLTVQGVGALLATAGRLCGVGDWRQQKGGGRFGHFRLVAADNLEFKQIVAEESRSVQMDAFEHPKPFDEDSRELLEWFNDECANREQSPEAYEAPDLTNDEDEEAA